MSHDLGWHSKRRPLETTATDSVSRSSRASPFTLPQQKLQMKKQMFDQRGSQYSTTWQTEMKSACFKSPAFCCIAIWCSPCVSYQNRVEALHNDMRFYTCCQGLLPCSGRMKEEQCPEFCLCLETCCCFPNSVLATRYLLQDEMQLENTKCDNCLFSTMVALQGLACVCYIAAIFEPSLRDTAALIDTIADCVYCSVCACMQTQHHDQIMYRNQNPQIIQPIVQGNPLLAPPMPVMQRDPNLTFVYPKINHTTGEAQGVPVQQNMYPQVR